MGGLIIKQGRPGLIKSKMVFNAGRTAVLSVLAGHTARAMPAKWGGVTFQKLHTARAQLALMMAVKKLAAEQAIVRKN